uniref:Potassium channel domain-containing protein n=2 Tax=Meloidogyne incognita group TaxID=654580 RepID=A0A914MJX3_MELIC
MTLFTTIGYGTIACQTALGKFASIVYALFGIPMMLMVLGDVGQLILGFLLYCRKSVKEYYRRWLLRAYVSDIIIEEDIESKIVEKNKLEEGEGEEEEEELSLSLLLPIVAIYILFVSTIVSLLDWSKDGKLLIGGLGFGDAFYFSFLSLATIGLGDVMPYNLQYTPLLAFLFLAGLALLSMVNSTIYVRLQNRFLAIMDCLEDFLDKIQYNNQKSLEGYFTFMSLSPSIKAKIFKIF